MGEALVTSEDAAQERVKRALDKLHDLIAARGETSPSAAFATALAADYGQSSSGISSKLFLRRRAFYCPRLKRATSDERAFYTQKAGL